ncbi:hypothetical protein GQ44DRAFT_66750 [Phaeosphaeriaceae sp. PMI808]|nr:hypothetical protein GQ44DRAFT_66750 [Phaeosphaeriaceae sp. PMI808]
MLHFGTAYRYSNPWSNFGTNTLLRNARCGPNICEKGIVIDWVSEYAWSNAFLQHIPKIRLMGDVQAWVQEKWYAIFERQNIHVSLWDHEKNVRVDCVLYCKVSKVQDI